MGLTFFQIDSFAERPFAGNPAGVCLLPEPREASWMQALAAERNVPATAFVAGRDGDGWDLRWFTPQVELPLCGHGTLAAAHALWESGAQGRGDALRLHSVAGELVAVRQEIAGQPWIEMDLPVRRSEALPKAPPGLLAQIEAALGARPAALAVGAGNNLLAELASEDEVRGLAPDHPAVARLPFHGVIVTARAATPGLDVVSRYFAPGAGIAEDFVTGSAHCALAPYWRCRLGRDELVGYQASSRGGTVRMRMAGDRVKLAGQAVTVLRGEIPV